MLNIKKTLREKIVESSVIIGAILIFAGFIKQYLYYNHFGIPIHQYLSLDEVLILFFADIAYILKLVFVTIIYSLSLLIFVRIIELSTATTVYLHTSISSIRVDRILFDIPKNKKQLNWYLFFSCLICFLGYCWFDCSKTTFAIVVFALYAYQFSLALIIWLTGDVNHKLTDSVPLLISLSVILYCKSVVDIEVTEKQSTNVVYTIDIAGKSIHSSKDTLFLGQSNDFIYLFNNLKKESVILKKEDLKQIRCSHIK